MPEGDTIFRTAHTLQRALGGQVVTRFSSVFPALNVIDENAPLTGRTVERVEAIGKHVLMHFSGDLCLRTHMRMSGSWHIYRPGERWQRPRDQLRIAIETAPMHALAFLVHEAEFLDSAAMRRSVVARLGPSILDVGFDETHAAERMRAETGRPLCDVLLDQRVLAGIGNVYKSELLFLARLHPLTTPESIAPAAAQQLAHDAAVLLRRNVGAAGSGRIETYGGLRRTIARSDPSERLWVYGRAGQACRECGTPIVGQRMGQHARSTYYCPRCQLAPVVVRVGASE
jgi:endonuclease-8